LRRNGTTQRSDTDSYGEAARVVVENPSSGDWELRITGYDVDGVDDPICGNDSIQVYFSYFYEDSDRDDSDGPYWDSISLFGVAPED